MSTLAADIPTVVLTTEERFKAALKEVRAKGFRVRQNVMQCCPGCIDIEALFGTDPWVLTWGGQENAYSWVDGEPFYRDSIRGGSWRYRTPKPEKMGDIIVHASDADACNALMVAFKAQDFEVEWDGIGRSVFVNF